MATPRISYQADLSSEQRDGGRTWVWYKKGASRCGVHPVLAAESWDPVPTYDTLLKMDNDEAKVCCPSPAQALPIGPRGRAAGAAGAAVDHRWLPRAPRAPRAR